MVKRRLSCELDPARQPGAGASAPQLSPRRPRPSPRVCWRARSTLLRRERSAKLAPSRGGMLNQSRNQKLSRLHHPLHGGQPFFALVSTPRRKSSSKSPMTGAVTCSASVSQNTRFAPDWQPSASTQCGATLANLSGVQPKHFDHHRLAWCPKSGNSASLRPCTIITRRTEGQDCGNNSCKILAEGQDDRRSPIVPSNINGPSFSTGKPCAVSAFACGNVVAVLGVYSERVSLSLLARVNSESCNFGQARSAEFSRELSKLARPGFQSVGSAHAASNQAPPPARSPVRRGQFTSCRKWISFRLVRSNRDREARVLHFRQPSDDVSLSLKIANQSEGRT